MASVRQRPRLSAFELVAGSWAILMRHVRWLAPAAGFPVALSMLLGVAALAGADNELSGYLLSSLRMLLDVLPWTLFGVAWHRLILLGEPPVMSVEWSRRHTRFALYLLAWRLPWLPPLRPEPDAAFVGLYLPVFLVLAIALAYVQARLSLFLPAAAIERSLSPSEAWSRSEGYGGLLFWSAFLAGALGLLLCTPLLLVSFLFRQSSTVAAKVAVVGVDCGMQLVLEALAVGTLALGYAAIRAREAGLGNV